MPLLQINSLTTPVKRHCQGIKYKRNKKAKSVVSRTRLYSLTLLQKGFSQSLIDDVQPSGGQFLYLRSDMKNLFEQFGNEPVSYTHLHSKMLVS